MDFAILRTKTPHWHMVQHVSDSIARIEHLTTSGQLSMLYANLYPLYCNLRGHLRKCLHLNVEALQDFSRAVELKEQYGIALNNRASVLIEMGLSDVALVDLNQCLSLMPHYSVAWSNMGIIYFNREDFRMALRCYNRALEADPNNYNVVFNRASAMQTLDNYVGALSDLLKLLRYERMADSVIKDEGISHLRGLLYFRSSDPLTCEYDSDDEE